MNSVIFLQKEGTKNSVRTYDLVRGVETVLVESEMDSYTWPVINKNYAIWGKSTAQDVAGTEGVVLKTGELFTLQEQGDHQNSAVKPSLDNNLVAWMAWRTGNGDIYASALSKPKNR